MKQLAQLKAFGMRFRRLVLGFVVAIGLAQDVVANTTPSAPAIERVDDIRRRLLHSDTGRDAPPADAAGTNLGLVAQWFNFPNWRNWGNWNNWRNWGNWGNWLNW